MNDHQQFRDRLLFYAANQLSKTEQTAVEKHLLECETCRADLRLWQATGESIRTESSLAAAPPDLADRALARIHAMPPLQRAFVRTGQLLNAQALLVHRELWLACAAVMAIGVAVALLAEKASVIHFVAPLVAAAGLAAVCGPEHDPTAELALSTPTSPWKILLARLTLVSGYNLLLALAASLTLLVFVPAGFLGSLIAGWLGPMAFLSALALLLSLWIGTSNAIALVYGLWLTRYLSPTLLFGGRQLALLQVDLLSIYRHFWQSPVLLLALSVALLGAALLSVKHSDRVLSRQVA